MVNFMGSLVRKPAEERKEVNPYAKLNLARNPFPPEGIVRVNSDDPVENGAIFDTTIRTGVLRRFKTKFIMPSKMRKINPMGYLWSPGGYENRGLGKTAILRYFQTRINRDYGSSILARRYKTCVIYLYPREDLKTLNHLCQLGLRRVTEKTSDDRSLFDDLLCIARYRAIERSFRKKLRLLNSDEKIRKLVDHNYVEELEIDFTDLSEKVTNIWTSCGVRSEVAESVAEDDLLKYCRSLSSRRFLNESIELFFNDLVGMFIAAYFTHAYVFVDDLYNMFLKATKRDVERFAEGLNYWQFRSQDSLAVRKRFYSFIITMHARSEEMLSPYWRSSGLYQSSSLNLRGTSAVLVDTLNLKEAKKLISIYLNYRSKYTYLGKKYNGHRINWNKAKKDSLSPFTEEAIVILAEHNGFHPRKMLNKEHGAFRILEEAIRADVNKISAEFVKKVLAEERPPPSEEEEESILEY